MKTLTTCAKKVIDFIKLAKEMRSPSAYIGSMTIGTIFNHNNVPNYIVTSIDVDKFQSVKSFSVKPIIIEDDTINIGGQMCTSSTTNISIVAYDGVAYLENLAAENTKKDILNAQIKDMEAKLQDMKSEISTM